MPYQIRVVTCFSQDLESELNKPASEGWQLVSCWPEDESVTAVFQRSTEASAPSSPAGSDEILEAPIAAPPPAAAPLPDLDAILAACLAQPERKSKAGKTYRQPIALEELAAAHQVEEVAMRLHLLDLGIREKKEGSKDKWHGDHYIAVVQLKNGKHYLSVTHAPAKKSKK